MAFPRESMVKTRAVPSEMNLCFRPFSAVMTEREATSAGTSALNLPSTTATLMSSLPGIETVTSAGASFANSPLILVVSDALGAHDARARPADNARMIVLDFIVILL